MLVCVQLVEGHQTGLDVSLSGLDINRMGGVGSRRTKGVGRVLGLILGREDARPLLVQECDVCLDLSGFVLRVSIEDRQGSLRFRYRVNDLLVTEVSLVFVGPSNQLS